MLRQDARPLLVEVPCKRSARGVLPKAVAETERTTVVLPVTLGAQHPKGHVSHNVPVGGPRRTGSVFEPFAVAHGSHRLCQASFDEQQIAEVTGHRSNAIRQYKVTSNEQRTTVSDALQCQRTEEGTEDGIDVETLKPAAKRPAPVTLKNISAESGSSITINLNSIHEIKLVPSSIFCLFLNFCNKELGHFPGWQNTSAN